MANRFYVGAAGGRWNLNANWSAASGGGGGASFPVAGDNAFLDVGSAGSGPTLTANAVCDQLDCTGFTGTLNLAGFNLGINTTLFKLVAGMTFTPAGGEVDFLAVAGNVLITTAGETLANVAVGPLGAGGTFQQQDAMVLSGNFNHSNGTWQTQNNNLSIGGNMLLAAALLAGNFVPGSAVVTVSGTMQYRSPNAVIVPGTSTFNFNDNGGIDINVVPAALTIAFYNLTIAAAGKTTVINPASATTVLVTVSNIFLTSTGTVNLGGGPGTITGIQVRSTLVNGFQPAATCAINVPIILTSQAVAGSTVLIPACVIGANVILTRDGGTYGAVNYQLTGAVAVTGTFSAYGGGGAAYAPTLDLNGHNLTVTGSCFLGNGVNGMGLVNIGGATFHVTGNLLHLGNPLVDSRIFSLAAGTLAVDGNFTHNGAVATVGQRINMTNNSLVRVGGNWNTTPIMAFNPVPVGDTSAVQFTAAGAFTISCNISEVWPVVKITGGGTVALPNPFVCTDLQITVGLVTAGAVLIVIRGFSNAGTFTGGANMYVGTSFVNSGTLHMAGVNLHLTGPVCSLAGFNPTTLTMEETCLRLQFLASMNVTTVFNIAPRLVPGVVQFLMGGNFTLARLLSQAGADCPVQFVSSVAGTRYNLTVTVLSASINIWPRDCNYAGAAFVGDRSNRDLGHNVNMTLTFPPAFIRVITEDAGQDLLAAQAIGPMSYCWLVATSLAALTAQAAAFAGGSNNWHRRTNIPFAFLDNLVLGTTYWIGLGLLDDRNNRVAPNVGAGDFATAVAISNEGGGGGAHQLHVNVQVPTMS